MAINMAVLVGRLTKAPELGYTKNNTALTTFTLAVDKDRKDDGANFIRIKCFGKIAETCDRYLSKGRQVAVLGKIDTSNYKDKNGNMVYVTDVIADRVDFLGGSGDNTPKDTQADNNIPYAELDTPDSFTAAMDEIPF